MKSMDYESNIEHGTRLEGNQSMADWAKACQHGEEFE